MWKEMEFLMLFLGTYNHCIDDKNRLIIPAKFRKGLQSSLCYVSKGLDNCLEVRKAETFEAWTNKLAAIPEGKNQARALKRKIMSLSEETKCDSIGRIKIAKNLLDHVGISRNVVVIGNGTKFEIWDPQVWETYQKANIDIEDIADDLVEWL